MTSGTLDRDGFVLRWVREGSGIPAIVAGSERFYRRYFPRALRDHFDIVFCDSRQWVPMPRSFDISTITTRTFCGDIDAVRKAVGFDRPVVIGQSQHGSMVLEYARHQPGDVRGVVAVAAPPPQWASRPESPQEFFERDGGAARRAAHERNRATRRVPTTFETSQDFIDDYVSNGATGAHHPPYEQPPEFTADLVDWARTLPG